MKRLHFRKIVRQHKDRIYTQAYYLLGGHEDAEDATQEVLLKIWERLDEVPRVHMTAWIMKVTRNLCIDCLRRRQRGGAGDEEKRSEEPYSTFPDPERRVEQNEIQRHIRREMQALPEPLRSVVILREIQDFKYEEIARAMDIPLNSVKVYLYRGRRILREKLSFLLE